MQPTDLHAVSRMIEQLGPAEPSLKSTPRIDGWKPLCLCGTAGMQGLAASSQTALAWLRLI